MTYYADETNPNNPDYKTRTCYTYHGHNDEFDIVYNGHIVAVVSGDFKCDVWIDEYGDPQIESLQNKPFPKMRTFTQMVKGEKPKEESWIDYPSDAPFYEEITEYFIKRAEEE